MGSRQEKAHRKIGFGIVERSDDVITFKVLPKQQIIKQTFGWLIQLHRLIRAYKARISNSVALIHLSITEQMLARIAA
ncbi:hypothetical protein N9058_01025 [bacterium]|nr:hypothetical protein [bacterium]